ncbi:MAG: winged helix-turn-helix transcriptional regulator [Deltaproteobacteria bacterium]|nr:winged helix-turn-helix transcriptional regulator [Deltaproteobacteria bacterium]
MGRRSSTADTFAALADPTRRALLDRLRAGSAPVNDLAEGFRMSRPAVSKHLRVLREARLVAEQRTGRQRVYQITPGPMLEMLRWLEGYRQFWQLNLGSLKAHLEKK